MYFPVKEDYASSNLVIFAKTKSSSAGRTKVKILVSMVQFHSLRLINIGVLV